MTGRSHIFGHTPCVSDIASFISAPDILPRHCRIRRVVREGQKPSTYVQAFPGAHVSRNGCPVSRETRLYPGDLLGLGEHVLLMYKDPRHDSGPPAWFPTCRGRPVTELAFGCPACGRSLCEDQEARRAYLASPLPALRCGEDEDGERKLLEEIIVRGSCHGDGACRLAPSYLFAACAQTSYEAYGPGRLAQLLVRIAGLVKKVVWETVKDIGDKRPESLPQRSKDRPSVRVEEMTSDLQPIMFWMANAVELLNFTQRKSSELEREEAEGLLDDPSDSVDMETCEEAMVLLDEVIMYTFQQCVYHLTKTLYSMLPALLDTNPFASVAPTAEEGGAGWTPPSVDSILAILGNALELGRGYMLHAELVSQMFGYLFFFCNASVLNTLMERGERGSFYQWTRGVQIRTNLDQVLDWTQTVGMADIASRYLQKLSTAVNLLCIPKTSLLMMCWDTLLEDHSALSPAQLYHLLSNYQVGPSRLRPSAWDPPPSALDELQKGEIFESFGEHPPLILPASEFRFSLTDPVESEEIRTLLCDLRQFAWELEKETLPVNQRPL
ncbi:ras-interacting protein 1 [Narcine bancroftii]|uniref:ras-interacting protein 1 n=1 Tax=Narcine bancroftii TaxID=1343680 RepID=UPI0038316551